MIRAKIVGDRAYCGRPGCVGDPFGVLEVIGQSGTVINLSARWYTRGEGADERWRRSAHNRNRLRSRPDEVEQGRREPGRWSKARPWPSLPAIVECPRCGAINEVATPPPEPNLDGVE